MEQQYSYRPNAHLWIISINQPRRELQPNA